MKKFLKCINPKKFYFRLYYSYDSAILGNLIVTLDLQRREGIVLPRCAYLISCRLKRSKFRNMAGMGDGYVGTAQDALRIRRLEKQRETDRKKTEDLKRKIASGQKGLLQFGSSASEVNL